MSTELVKALMTVFRYCVMCDDCRKCKMREFCGKNPQCWDN